MPMGMHTVINPGATTLSCGQIQRLLIARAIASKPRIFLLDEATSALDNRSQAIVTESLNRMRVTRVVIAHRLSTIMNADKIFVIVKGELVELGDYHSLLARNGSLRSSRVGNRWTKVPDGGAPNRTVLEPIHVERTPEAYSPRTRSWP